MNTLFQSQKNILLFTIFFLVSLCSFAQQELMIYGTVKSSEKPEQRARIKVEETKTFKILYELWLDADGQYRIDLPYGKIYTIYYYSDGFTPMIFDANLVLPADAKQCCYRPMNISFHFFTPDSAYTKLFKETFYTIAYSSQLKNFNYDIDVDYMVQQKIVNYELFESKKLEAREGLLLQEESVLQEKKYLAYINQATQLYNDKYYYAARRLFLEAKKIRPNRMYPQYKLEDIKTELERFEHKAELLGVNVDSLIQQELTALNSEQESEYPPYVPLTQAQIEQIFKQEVENQIMLMADSPQEVSRLMGLMQEFFRDDFTPDQIAVYDDTPQVSEPFDRTVDFTSPTISVTDIDTDTIESTPLDEFMEDVPHIVEQVQIPDTTSEIEPLVVEKPKQETVTETVKPRPLPKVVDYSSYQDSLRQKYPETRTVEYSEDANKKITRVFLNNGKVVEVYTRIIHSWGATYYYFEEYPSGYQSIGYSAFMSRTKLYELEGD